MFYFSKNDETIKKYQVNFDKEEIEKIIIKLNGIMDLNRLET